MQNQSPRILYRSTLPILRLPVLHCCVLVAVLILSRCAAAEVVVIIGANTPTITLNKNQLSDLFLGKVISLPNGHNAVPIDQPASSPLRDEFYMKVTNKSATEARALWAKLYFTGRGVPPREGADSDDIKKLVNSVPNSIGYIERASLDSNVKTVFVAP